MTIPVGPTLLAAVVNTVAVSTTFTPASAVVTLEVMVNVEGKSVGVTWTGLEALLFQLASPGIGRDDVVLDVTGEGLRGGCSVGSDRDGGEGLARGGVGKVTLPEKV